MINPDAIVNFSYNGSNFTLTKADGSTIIHPYSDKFHQFTGGGLKQLGTIVGLEEVAIAIGTFGPDGNKNPGSAGTFVVPAITVDKYGRTTSVFNRTITMPAATSVSLNGASTTSASFYAPITAGTNGQVLKSNGSGEPTWITLGSNAYTSTAYLPLTGGTITGNLLCQVTTGETHVRVRNTTLNGQIYMYANDTTVGIYGNMGDISQGIIKFTSDGALTFNGTATKATQDGNGNVISSTYLPLSGGTLTGQLNTCSIMAGSSSSTSIYTINTSRLGSDNTTIGRFRMYVNSAASGGILDFLSNGTSVNSLTMQANGESKFSGTVASSLLAVRSNSYPSIYLTNSAGTQAHLQLYANASSSSVAAGVVFRVWSSASTYSDAVSIANTGKLYGAVWNDYAEYRSQNEELKPGYITYCDDDGKLKLTTERLQKFEGVVSDTYGFAIGKNERNKTPLAVSGRALVYCDPEEEHFHAGDCVCAGPDGLAYRMTREEIIQFPDRIVGIVSEIPTYKTWGETPVEVNGRIWIKVR